MTTPDSSPAVDAEAAGSTARGPAPEPVESPPKPTEPANGFTDAVAKWLGSKTVDYERDLADKGIAISRRGHVRFSADGPDLGPGDLGQVKDPLRFIVVQDGARPRIVTNDRTFRLLVHVDPSDAVPILIAYTALRPTAEPLPNPPTHGFVALHPGARVEPLEEQGSALRIRYRRGKETYEGWVSTDALAKTAIGHRVPPPETPGHVTSKTVPLEDRRSGGKTMLKVPKNQYVTVLAKGDGHAFVDVRAECDRDVSMLGFIRESAIVEAGFGRGYSCGSSGSRTLHTWGDKKQAPRHPVEAGRFLTDDRGRIVGCVLEDAELADLGDGNYAVPTPWGPLPVRLAPADFGAPCGTGAE